MINIYNESSLHKTLKTFFASEYKGKTEIKIDGDKVSIKLDEITRFDQKSYMDVTFARFRISKDIWDNMDYEKVEFVDEFEKKVEEPAEEEAEE